MYSSIFINWPIGPKNRLLLQKYQEALSLEIERNLSYFKQPIESVFISAKKGDSSVLKWLLDTSGTLSKTPILFEKAEFSLEVGPQAVFDEQIKGLNKVGINRVVLCIDEESNVQIGDIANIIAHIKSYINNISIDLYTVCPELIEKIVQLPITHISLYCLDNFIAAKKMIQDAGFIMYEWQHFAKLGFESVHMKNCWDRKPYKGFGVGASSFDGATRSKNVEDIKTYIERIENNKSAQEYKEKLTDEDVYIETIITGLRKPQGISKKLLTHNSQKKMADLIGRGFLQNYQKTIGYTDRGFLVENQIITQII